MVGRLACVFEIFRLLGSVGVGRMSVAELVEVYQADVTRFGDEGCVVGPS